MNLAEGKAAERKKKLGQCIVKFCSRQRGKKRKFCNRCHSRNQAIVNPIGYRFNNIRCKAKHRGKDFTLTLPNFRDWAAYHKLLERGLTVDCKNARYGYHIWNIAPLGGSENSSKGRKSYVEYYQQNPDKLPEGTTPEDFSYLDFEIPETENPPF